MKYYLGIDNGGTVTKAALYTKDGREVAVESRRTEVVSRAPGFAERDMDDMREANFEAVRALLERSGVPGRDVAGVACCGHGKGLYLWGRNGRPVRPGILSSDNRAWEYPERWKRDGTAEKVFARTFQRILACQPVSLLAWMRDHEPDKLEEIRWIFECKDYVRFCLTGEAYAEMTDYSGANLVNLETRDYDPDLLAMFGLSDLHDRLPPLRSSTDLCGRITPEAARRTGLSEGTPVFGGMFDIDACAVAVDAADEDTLCMIAGTWSINEYVRAEPVRDGSVMMNSIFCVPDRYLVEESSPTSAVNLEWFLATLAPDAAREPDAYAAAAAWVESVPPSDACPIFLPFLMAGNSHPNAKACFLGMTYYHTRAHLAKAVYEGIAFSHRYHVDRLKVSRSRPFERIRLAGGVAKSTAWVRMFADVLGSPIEIVDIRETGTLGCAMNVAVALGDYADFGTAARGMIQVRPPVAPDSDRTREYDRRYRQYRAVLEALDPVWDGIQDLFAPKGGE
jgi:L-xylulokinase